MSDDEFRDEYLEFCKRRAREYLKAGDVVNAIASMGSDLMKHDKLKAISVAMMPIGLYYAMHRDLEGARRWIEGFR